MQKRPILGITMGNPFGNGPEITAQALADPEVYKRCRPLVVGDASSMAYALKVAEKIHGIRLELHRIQQVEQAWFRPGTIDLLDMGKVPEDSIPNSLTQPEPAPAPIDIP